MEAIGEPLPTNTLPLAFAQADLRANTGWKAQIEAAERLARTGAVSVNKLIGVYTQGRPSASGEPWDRIAAVQKLDAAIRARDAVAVSRSLPPAWEAMQAAGLEIPFAMLYGKRLANLHLTPKAATMAYRIGLLSPDYESLAAVHNAIDPSELFLAGLARGSVQGLNPPDAMARAIAPAFATPPTPGDDLGALLDEQKPGEAILRAIKRISEGAAGDLRGVTDGLTLLRAAGLETVARRTALQLMLLERRRMTVPPALTMPRWIGTFLEAQAAELDAARNTRLAYGRDLGDFSDWLAHRKLDFAMAARSDIEAYLIDCDARGLARATRARRLSSIRQLYRFAHDEGWRDDNPALQITGPGKDKRLPIDPVDRRSRGAAASRADLGARHRHGAQHLPDGTPLCHRHAGQRAGGPAGLRRARRSSDAVGDRQGRQGPDGAIVTARSHRTGSMVGVARSGGGGFRLSFAP